MQTVKRTEWSIDRTIMDMTRIDIGSSGLL